MGSEKPQPAGAPTVLILTAAVAGGHESAARAVRAELEASGYRTITMDGVRPLSHRLEWCLRQGYEYQLRYAPWTYGLGFRAVSWPPIAGVLRPLAGRVFARRMLSLITPEQPDLVVSTYPLVTMALGCLRRSGKWERPALALVTDYGAHPYWVAPGVDLHLAPSGRSADLAEAAGGRTRVADLPLAPGFREPPTRKQARSTLGVPESPYVVLVSGGAWGVGDIAGTTASVVAAGAWALVVTGQNTALQRRLEERFRGEERARIFGWTDEMPTMMAAADCLIQNAGGMTCLEAMALGLPILFYKTLPGHAVGNAQVMEEVGAARWIRSAEELSCVVRAAMAGEHVLEPPRKETGISTLAAIEEVISVGPCPVEIRPRSPMRPVLGIAAVLAVVWWIRFSPRGVSGRANRWGRAPWRRTGQSWGRWVAVGGHIPVGGRGEGC